MFRHQDMPSSGNRIVQEVCVGIKFPEDGILVPKHVEVGTYYEVCFMTYFIAISTFCWLKYRRIK